MLLAAHRKERSDSISNTFPQPETISISNTNPESEIFFIIYYNYKKLHSVVNFFFNHKQTSTYSHTFQFQRIWLWLWL
jgi:hypothetical protein